MPPDPLAESPAVAAPAPAARPRLPFWKPRWMKKAVNLSQGVRKFIQYNRDRMPEERRIKVLGLLQQFEGAIATRRVEEVESLEKNLVLACEGAVPDYKTSAIKENIEVIVVAIVVALGIRAYFLQPFKIPTASMQPTLNGITAKAMTDGKGLPNPLVRALDYVGRGRNYVNLEVPQDWGTVQLTGIRQRSRLHFFTVTDLVFRDGANREKVLTGYVPAKHLMEYLWVHDRPILSMNDWSQLASGQERVDVRVLNPPVTPGRPGPPNPHVIAAGTLLARGYVDTGDQVLVNKMAYHFRRPDRGEVFVFGTRGIRGISGAEGVESQHYIKRLTGVPGDSLQLKLENRMVRDVTGASSPSATLYINGAPATEPGMQKVMSRENGYPGYSWITGGKGIPWAVQQGMDDRPVKLGPLEYMAMGDNSPNSSDSRVWGPVPQQNLVGPALMVYWPFLPHFGLIR